MPAHRNATYTKFGGDNTLLADDRHWCVLVRPKQVTLGALVLLSNSDHTRFSDLPREAFAELASITPAIEACLDAFIKPDKLNYLMLMMVDPHVHFHVIPRYSGVRHFEGAEFPDTAWPGPPELSSGTSEPSTVAAIRDALVDAWPGPA